MVSAVKAKILPNVRKLIIPDPGHLIADADLSGADAQVVAWEAGDEDLKDAFKKGLKIHIKNATDMLGEEFTSLQPESGPWKQIYASMKAFVHGVNYGEQDRTLAITQGWPIALAHKRRLRWLGLHPAISAWHQRVQFGLEKNNTIRNAYGFHRIFFDRPGTSFTNALAWGPQSTVAITCTRGALQLRERLPWVQILLQVHDSLVFQFPRSRIRDVPLIREALLNPIPYADPLTIPWGLALSPRSWGECKKMGWEEASQLNF